MVSSQQPRAFVALDLGSATTSVALVGNLAGRWRLIAYTGAPCRVEADALIAGLLRRIHDADPLMLEELGASQPIDPEALALAWPRFVASTTPPRRLAVLAATKRQRHRLETVASRSGWKVAGGSSDDTDPVDLERLILSPDTNAVLLGADRSPGGDEKRDLPDLAAMVAAATRLRPELMVILAGGAAAYESIYFEPPASPAPIAAPATEDVAPTGEFGEDGQAPPAAASAAEPTTEPASGGVDAGADMPVAHVLLAPDAEAGSPAGSSLQQVLEGLRAEPGDSRLNIARSIASLSYVLDRSVEAVEVGYQGGLMARSEPFGHGHFSIVSSHACPVDGAFAPADASDDVIDGLTAWSTQLIDRHRLTDRLMDLRVAPWGNCEGDGATFRLAAAKAAIARLVAATPDIAERPMPELIVAAGGILSSLPASVVALALADLVRRSGVTQIASDPARLLGPLGTIEDEGERRKLLASLADDILLPMATLVVPAGIKPGKSAGELKLKGSGYVSEIELHPGAIQVVDLPSGRSATAELNFRDAVTLGTRGHRFSMPVSGGLVGLLLDLRDVPMRISERPETRRAVLEAWQKGMWPEVDE